MGRSLLLAVIASLTHGLLACRACAGEALSAEPASGTRDFWEVWASADVPPETERASSNPRSWEVWASAGVSSQSEHATKTPRSWEVWAGADATSHTWLVYSGVTLAPFGGIHDNGWRLRAAGGHGGYRYSHRDAANPPQQGQVTTGEFAEFEATTNYSEVLAGYLYRFGPLTVKAFAGAAVIQHDIEPTGIFTDPDIYNGVQGTETGFKGAVELWLDMGERAWTSIDLNWTTAHETGSGRMRTGYRVDPRWSAGLESILDTNAEHREGRGGLFVRYEWEGGEVSAAGGVSGDLPKPGALEFETTPYGNVNWIAQF